MKKEITTTATFCDECKKQEYTSICLSCETEHCYECRREVGEVLPYSVWFGGGDEGYFCNKCIVNPRPHAKELLNAYLKMKQYRIEYKSWFGDFDKRATELEEKIKVLLGKNPFVPQWRKE